MLRRFDDRLVSTVSANPALKGSPSVPDYISQETPSPLSTSIFEWSAPEILVQKVLADPFVQKYGEIVAIEPSLLFCAVATDHGQIVCFDYAQNVQYILGSKDRSVSVAALTFSPDSLTVCGGYLDGSIWVWDLKKLESMGDSDWDSSMASPMFQISPEQNGEPHSLPLGFPAVGSRSRSFAPRSIQSISFVAGHNDVFLSLSANGNVSFHHVAKNIFANYHTRHQLASDILALATLPLGPEPNFTDRLGVFAYISPKKILIGSCLSLNDSTAYHQRIHHSEPIVGGFSQVSLDWCPQPARVIFAPLKVAFSADNTVVVILLSTQILTHVEHLVDNAADKDKASPPLIFEKTASWTAPQSIIAIKWLNHRLLTVFMETAVINLYLNPDSLVLEPVSHENVAFEVMPPPVPCCPRQIKRWKNRLFILPSTPNSPVKIAARRSWIGILNTITDPPQRAKLAAWLYSTTNQGLVVLLGLPSSLSERRQVLGSTLSAAVIDAVFAVFDSNPVSSVLSSILDLYFDTAAKLASQSMNLTIEDVLVRVDNDSRFFGRLQPFILSGRITQVPPAVLQRLVKYYAESDRELLIRFLCILDISLLDIDLTMHLCEKYGLVDCSIYIYNTLFNDFETPLHDLYRALTSSIPSTLEVGNLDVIRHNPQLLLIFIYLTYTLTCRQYPTEESISSPQDMLASNTAIRFLLHTNNSDSMLYPRLMMLARHNALAFFVMFNEFFECSFLNDSHQRTYSRQYIVDALIDAFEYHDQDLDDHDQDLDDQDHTLFAIFIARNYAKYPQFIRLSESQLDSVSFRLCRPTTTADLHEDCELALMSLLAHYSPADPRHLLAALHQAHHHRVLLAFYRSRSQYSQVLAVWIEQIRATPLAPDTDTLDNVLGHLWSLPADATERAQLNAIVKSSFPALAEYDAAALALLVSKHAPRLHSQALALTDMVIQKRYLGTIFSTSANNSVEFLPLFCTYLRILTDESEDPYQLVLDWALTLAKEPVRYEEARLILMKSSHSARSFSQLLLARGLYEEALDAVVGRLAELCTLPLSRGSITEHLAHAIEICIMQDGADLGASNGIELASVGEDMWLKLTLVLVVAANVPQADYERTQFLNECVGNCFRSMTDVKLNGRARGDDARQASFVRIFNRFLETNMRGKGAEHNTNLANISHVLQHVFLSYSSQTELLQVSVQMLNREIHRRIDLLQAQNLQGWAVSERNCAKCLKAVWGLAPILYRHFEAWQDRQRRNVFPDTEDSNKHDEDYSDCTVVYFKCSHSYHAKCMSVLQDTSLHSLTCIVCET